MVLSERNTGDIVRNGRRSRGPSPNTHTTGGGGGVGGAANAHNASGGGGIGGGGGGGGGSGANNSTNATANDKATAAPGAGTPESSDDDNCKYLTRRNLKIMPKIFFCPATKRNGKSKAKQSEYEEKIRVGRDYQAVCPQLVAEPDRRPELMNERALLVWSPTKEIPDMKLEEYISVAKEKYGYNGEQALGMLFWHKHDLERAVMDLANFTPFPDEWTTEDKVLFEQAFQFHGKSFHRIRQMLPDKSIASLVKYYYSWKKTRHRSSAMDRQEKIIKAAVKEGSENGSEVGSNEESDNDDKRATNNNSTMNNNNNNNSSNNSNSSSHNAGTTSTQGSNGNNSNSTGDTNNGGASSSSGVGSGGDSSTITTNNNNDLDSDQLCIYTNALGDDMLGFGLPGFGLPIDNGNEHDIDSGNGNGNGIVNHSGNARRNVVGGFCKICNVVCYILFDTPLGRMCTSCQAYWRRTGHPRPISGPESITPTKRSTHNSAAAAAAERSRRKPPRGMYINHDDLATLAACQNPCEYLAEGDRKIAALLAEIQKNRQMLEQLEKDCSGDAAAAAAASNLDDSREPKATPAPEGAGATQPAATATATAAAAATVGNAATTQPRIAARWTQEEISMAMLALRDYGKNFPMIAKVVGTKTEAHVRTFYVSHRRRHNLDQIVKEYEASTAKDEAVMLEQEQSSDATAATTATTGAAAAVSATVANDVSEGNSSSQELLAKKDDAASSTTNTNSSSSSKKKPDLSAAKNNESAAAPTAGAGTGATVVAAGNGSKSTTITIADESDTATSCSSDVGNNGAAVTTNNSNSASSLS
ncbi:hypothetical protein KR093_001335, partial [Drosophila rubida]